MTFTKALQRALRADGCTMYAIQQACGVDRSVLCRFLNDERTMSVSTADRVLAALGLTVTLTPKQGKAK